MNYNKVGFSDWGEIPYKDAWDKQESILAQNSHIKLENRKANKELKKTSSYLIFCSHPHVFTLGKSGSENHLLLKESFLKNIHATYYKTNRGGDITYHGPGQLVGYPILDLELFKTDIHWYLRSLEECIILLCQSYQIEAGRVPGLTGVWVDPSSPFKRKICAMGVKASRWITMHGFALNINTDLSYFDYIVPCGISEYGVTSLKKELGEIQNIEEVKSRLKHIFEEVFSVVLNDVPRGTFFDDEEF